jgi:hypothetical protein
MPASRQDFDLELGKIREDRGVPVVGSGHEQPVPIFQQLARGHPLVVMK